LVVILLMVIMPQGLWTLIIAMTITGWIGMARIVRGEVLKLKSEEFILASKSLGASTVRIMTKHLVPNAIGAILVTLTLTIPNAIFTEAFLSFLGLGVPAPQASWGTMSSDALSSLRYYPYQLFFPAFFISLTMLAFNVVGDGLSDALDPQDRYLVGGETMKKLLEVNNLSISFHTYGGEVQAVRDVNFDLHEGETLAIVGESGSGKSVTVQSVMRLISMPPGEFKSGS